MYFRVFFVLVLVFSFFIGCSGGNEITSPGSQNPTGNDILTESVGLMVDGFTENQTPLSGAGILGLFQGNINPVNLTGELVSLRSAAIDDTLEIVDITNFLTMAPCTDCAKIIGIELDSEEHIVLKIGVKHPFGVGEPLKPITGKNRADLHVFNVEGTVIIDDSVSSTPFPGLDDVVGPGYLLNADGYSPYLDIALDNIFNTNATVHPYILHFDDYTAGNFNPSNPMGFESVTDPPPSGNLVMPMGSDYDIQNYIFDISLDDSFEFLFAVGCTYAVSTVSMSQRFSPEYQIPQHNKKAASEVSVEIASNNFSAGNSASSAELVVKVLDMNHGVAVGNGLDEMKVDSSVSAIQAEITGVTSGFVSGTTIPTGGNGRDPADPLTFPITVYNDLEAGEGTYSGLVKVIDAYPAGLNESPLLGGMDAIKRADPLINPLLGLYALDEFATYMTFNINIGTGNTPPVAAIDPAEILNICDGATVTFDASASTDLEDDNAIPQIPLNFEFDFDYDGVDFVSDTGAPTTDPIATSPPYFLPGPILAAVRVTDSGGLTDIATADVDFSTEVHEYVGSYNITGVSYLPACFNGDINFIEAGPNAGKILFCYDRGKFALIDPEAEDQEAIPFNSDAGEWAGNFHYIIESCPMTGRVFTPIHAKGNIYAPDGEYLELWEDDDSARFAALEIADNGDMWAVMQAGSELHLRHYTYSDTSPYYEKPAVHITDLTADFPPDDRWVCIDLVMDFEQDKIFTFMGRWAPDWDYSVVAYDVSTGYAVKLAERKDVFTKQIIVQVGGVQPFDYGRKADIQIDHSLDEQCRILVGGITYYDTDGYHYELARLDDELNTIDFYDGMPYGSDDNVMPNTFVIASTGTHPIIALPQDIGWFMYFETDNW